MTLAALISFAFHFGFYLVKPCVNFFFAAILSVDAFKLEILTFAHGGIRHASAFARSASEYKSSQTLIRRSALRNRAGVGRFAPDCCAAFAGSSIQSASVKSAINVRTLFMVR
jgi:hypothetical protein